MSVYKDKEKGTWFFTIRKKMRNGKTKQLKRRGFKTKTAAKEAEAKLLLSTDENNLSKVTFREVAEHFLKEKKHNLKETSYDRYTEILDQHILSYFGNYQLNEITPINISDWKNLQSTKLSNNTCCKHFSILRGVFEHGVNYFDLPKNPCSVVDNFKSEKKQISFFTEEEFNEFISIVDDPRDKLIFYTLFYTGMRLGELLALQWKDLENNTIHITKAVIFPAGKPKIGTPKTKASVRDISIPHFLVEMLKDYKNSLIDKITKFNDDFYIFGEVNFLTHNSLHYRLRKYSKNVNVSIKNIRIHDFRHSHASYLINVCRANPILVAQRLGHENKSTTLDIYSHLYPTENEELLKNMENAFENVAKMLP